MWKTVFKKFEVISLQWHIQRFSEKTVFSGRFKGRRPKEHNPELWRIIFSYKHVWMAWVELIYCGKCNYFVFINSIRHCVRGEFIQNYFKIFGFLLIWYKNLGSHTGWPVAKPLWIHHCTSNFLEAVFHKFYLVHSWIDLDLLFFLS